MLVATWPACHVGEGPLVAFLGDSLTAGVASGSVLDYYLEVG